MILEKELTLEELLVASKNMGDSSISDQANKNETYKLRMMVGAWGLTDTYGENIDFLSSLQSYGVYFKKGTTYLKVISLVGAFIDGIIMTLSDNSTYCGSDEIGLAKRIEVRNI